MATVSTTGSGATSSRPRSPVNTRTGTGGGNSRSQPGPAPSGKRHQAVCNPFRCGRPDSTRPAAWISERAFLGTNADDCLTPAPLGRVQGGDGLVEGRDVADVRPQPSVPHPLDDLTQLATIGLDHEVDPQSVGGLPLVRVFCPH